MPNHPRRIKALAVAGALALTAWAAPAFPELPATRAEALAELKHPDAATRAEAVVWIANHGTQQDDALLHERLRDESPFVRGFAERGLWLLWGRSGDPEVDRLMARGTDEQQAGRLADALTTYGEVIRRKPEFAEGWNRRATVHFLAGDLRASIADCDEVLKRNPRHFGALAGLGQIHFRLEDYPRALEWYRRALEVNPNMIGVEVNIRKLEELLKARGARST